MTDHTPDKNAAREFTQFLAKNGHKRSQERFAVLDAAARIGGVFQAAELHAYINAAMNFRLSLSTVYSSLGLLAQCGVVVRHVPPAGPALFEYAYGKTAFKYTICSKCGRISAIHDRALDRAISAVKTPRLHFSFYKTYIYGVCASCARKEKSRLRKTNKQDNDDTRKG